MCVCVYVIFLLLGVKGSLFIITWIRDNGSYKHEKEVKWINNWKVGKLFWISIDVFKSHFLSPFY